MGTPAQESFWRSTARYCLYVGGVGAGKTFAGALKLLTQPPGLYAVVAPTYGLVRDVCWRTFLELVPDHLLAGAPNRSLLSVKLTTGHEVIFRSADRPERLVGVNLSGAWGDEWAFVDEEAHDRLLARLRVGNAKLWITTTPNGQNWLYKRFVEKPSSDTEVIRARTADNPYLPAEYVRSLQEQYGGAYALQELEGRFVDLAGTKRIPPEWMRNIDATADPIEDHDGPSMAGLLVYRAPVSGASYILGVDPSEGLPNGDASPVCVVDRETGEMMAVLDAHLEPTETLPRCISHLARWYNNGAAMVERNNHGGTVIAACQRLGVKLLSGLDRRPGWNQTTASKVIMWDRAAAAARESDGAIPDARTIAQVSSIDRNTLCHPGKRKGQTAVDDLATAWALAMAARATPSKSAWLKGFSNKRGR